MGKAKERDWMAELGLYGTIIKIRLMEISMIPVSRFFIALLFSLLIYRHAQEACLRSMDIQRRLPS